MDTRPLKAPTAKKNRIGSFREFSCLILPALFHIKIINAATIAKKAGQPNGIQRSRASLQSDLGLKKDSEEIQENETYHMLRLDEKKT